MCDVFFARGRKSYELQQQKNKMLTALYESIHPRVFEIPHSSYAHTCLLHYNKYVVRTWIHAFKFEYDRYARSVLSDIMSMYIEEFLREIDVFIDEVIITIVPDTRRRVVKYGVGHMTTLFKSIQTTTHIDNTNISFRLLLSWKRQTQKQQQTIRSKKERLINVHDTMKCSYDLKNKTILVIDDVCTTGATLAEAHRALTVAGAETVYTLALAH